MNERQLRAVVGLILVCGEFGTAAGVALLTHAGRFEETELFATLAVVAPLLGVYATAAVRRLMSQALGEVSQKVPWEVATLSICIPLALVAMLASAIYWKAFGDLGFNNFLKLAGAIQTFTGVYLAIVVERMFQQRTVLTAGSKVANRTVRRIQDPSS